MTNQLVTIAVYGDPNEGNIVKSKLESEGIYCFLANEELMSSPDFRTIIGQVELQVKSEDAEKAKQILGL
ncbi:DUF2007 domain-containing protein [Candidatus Gottesmanbacteria bacterium]|nr:DUF2007 domain-containing protein [Candidatus Gottesmanbacteria bacterium]